MGRVTQSYTFPSVGAYNVALGVLVVVDVSHSSVLFLDDKVIPLWLSRL